MTLKTPLRRRLAAAGSALLVAVLLAGCGDDGHGDPGGHDNGAPTGAASVGAPDGATFNDTDVRFATDMIGHHRQAVDMARMAETRSTNPKIKKLAGDIEAAQGPEIETMSRWLRRWGQPVPSAGPSMSGMGHGDDMPGMEHGQAPGMMTEPEMRDLMSASGRAFDVLFLDLMIRHHQGAIEMANTERRQGRDAEAKRLAATIVSAQTTEIALMKTLP